MITKDLELLQEFINAARVYRPLQKDQDGIETNNALARIRVFVSLSIVARLERVESDLRALHAAHHEHRHTTLGDTRIGTSRPSEPTMFRQNPLVPKSNNPLDDMPKLDEMPLGEPTMRDFRSGYRCLSDDARYAVDRLAKALGVSALDVRNSDATNLHGLATCAEATAVALRALETQDTRSWAKIEEWYNTQPKNSPALAVSIEGPFGATTEFLRPSYYARLPGGAPSRGNTRADALAHAAQWCENELARVARATDDTCATCQGRRRDHEGADHAFVKEHYCALCGRGKTGHDLLDHPFAYMKGDTQGAP